AEACGRILAIQNCQVGRKIFLELFQVVLHDRTTGLADRVTNKQNFHGEKRKTPQQACDATYLNLLNRWASYPRFRGPRDPSEGVRPTHHASIRLPNK